MRRLSVIGVNPEHEVEFLRKKLERLVRERVMIVPPEECDVLITLDQRLPEYFVSRKVASRNSRAQTFLIAREPSVILPTNFSHWASHYSWRYLCGGQSGHKTTGTLWPNIILEEEDLRSVTLPLSKRRPAFALINTNRFSGVFGNLYELRRICSQNPKVFLFGRDWKLNRSTKTLIGLKEIAHAFVSLRPPDIIGFIKYVMHPSTMANSVDNKFEVLSNFQGALVIENSLEYASEKVFEAIEAGCFVVYVGGVLPPELEAVVVRADKNPGSISKALAALESVSFDKHELRLRALTESKFWQTTKYDHVMGEILGDIAQRLTHDT